MQSGESITHNSMYFNLSKFIIFCQNERSIILLTQNVLLNLNSECNDVCMRINVYTWGVCMYVRNCSVSICVMQ